MYIIFWCSSLLGGRCYVQLHLKGLVKIILFEASICCILCCWVNSIDIKGLVFFGDFIFIFCFDFFVIKY